MKMPKNTGTFLENEVYKLISKMVERNEFMVSYPNIKIRKKPKYYSKDRDADIEFDVSVEKYLGNPDEKENMCPSIIVVIECKDYSNSIPVDDVEEFHAKLQQIGADNTKGMMITQNGYFQRGALTYANSKGIALARILPPDQIIFAYLSYELNEREYRIERSIEPLTEKDYISYNYSFFSSTGDDLRELIAFLSDIKVNYPLI